MVTALPARGPRDPDETPRHRRRVRQPARRPADAPGVLVHDKTLRKTSRHPAEKVVAAHPAPRVRHAPARSWRGFASGADAARSCGFVDDADLYARGEEAVA